MDYEGKTKKRKLGTAENAPLATAIGGEYEVFLSFKGKDTRKGFTDFLYNDLDEKGIHTFRDDDELRVGEEIGPELLQAIKESKISIPIFSQNYASSKWCLLELAQMVVCQKTMGQKILPIFYDVEPCDVRHQTGSYEEAFRQHEETARLRKKGFDERKVQEWREALREVGQLKGWELEKINNGHQGRLVKIVVGEVLTQLKKNYMVVTDKLVGIDHHIEEMKRLLNVVSNEVRIVGIYGMGGLGKTTIAKFVYNELFECFDCCCFLADVREKAQQDSGLVNLQKQLISKIRKGKVPDIASVDEGINMIKGMACKKKVLIVLDDVDEESQFANLVGKRDWFGSRSRIIVTTRYKKVLNVIEVAKMYEPDPMKPDHALQLFSRHAFKSDFPPVDYLPLSEDIVSTTGGLPLTLEIIGSLLVCERDKEEWVSTSKKLKSIPHEKVQKKLRISYDALNDQEKQIFLDIACFFIGTNKTLPFYMWNDCEYHPTSGINILVLRSLVKIGDDNEFRMHDQLRDLGREIVRKESTVDPGERSRLWICKEALDVLVGQTGTKKVEALCLQTNQIRWKCGEHSCTNDEFWKLPNLRFLRVDCTDLTGDFKNLLSKLRWLQWHMCTDNSKPINFHLKNLVILDLSHSFITENWEGWSQIKMAKKLKVLDLSFCEGLTTTPDFSTFVSLERLILQCCGNLVEIGPSIGNLINLRVLDISWSRIRKLPDAVGCLEKLEEIYASSCDDFEGVIPSNIGRLSSLRIFMLDSTRICSLPMSICGLSCLQTLNLTLGRLETLDLTFGRDFLQSLPELPPSLRSLRLAYYFMETLPSLSNLMNLSDLMLLHCHKLKEIQGLERLESLRYLDASWCTSLKRLPDLSNLVMLKGLNLHECKKLAEVGGLMGLKSLENLDMIWCTSLKRLPDLSNLVMLKGLNLCECRKLAEVGGLTGLKSLENLDMRWCISLERLPDLSNLVMLKGLNLRECEKLAEVGGLGGLKSLEKLDMRECISLERLPDLSNLGMLKILNISGCEKLAEVAGLGGLKSLENLYMRWCISLERLPDLSNMGMLKILDLSRCEKLAEVGGLGGLKSLEILKMSRCNLFEALLDLSNLKNLKKLAIRGWKNLTEVQGLEELKSLEILDISCCRLLEKSLDLSNLQKLKELKTYGCEKLPEIRGLEELESLTLLDISGCKAIEKLPNLSNTKILTDSFAARIWAKSGTEFDSDLDPDFYILHN